MCVCCLNETPGISQPEFPLNIFFTGQVQNANDECELLRRQLADVLGKEKALLEQVKMSSACGPGRV